MSLAPNAPTLTPALRSLLWPRSVAIIGADPDPTKMNGAPVRNLLDFGFSGSIYPVTSHAQDIHGVQTFSELEAIDGEIDTVVIAVKAERALAYLEQCGRMGIRSATIVSAGFSEGAAKETGEALTLQLSSIVERFGIRVLGPNTAGLINLRHNYVPRAALNHFPPKDTIVGNAAVICQSGAISNILYNKCQANGVGVAYSLATGDQIDLDVWDFIEFAINDEVISQILCVVEGFRDARRFADVAHFAAERRKPVLLLKLGRSKEGARMVATHSGSMAGSYLAFSALVRQSGLIEVLDFDAFWELARLFAKWGTTSSEAQSGVYGKLGAFAISGGDAAFIADEVSTSPLELSRTAKSFDDFVSRSFSFAAGGNPFDCTGEVLAKPALLKDAMRAFIADNDFDYTMIAAPVFRSELATKIYPQIVEGIRDTESRVAVSAWTAGKLTDAGISIFRRADLPIFDHCGRAIRAIGTYDRWLRDRSTAVRLVFPNSALKRTDPFYAELRMELANAGILFGPASHFASLTDLGPSKDLFSASAGPYVFKLNCRTQLHKSTAGLVRFGIHDVPSLADAIDAMPCDLEHAGFMLEQQLRADVEVYVGGTTDPDFGKLIIAGFGGRFAEHLGGTALWLGDASPQDIQRWLGSSPLGKGLDVLDGTVLHELARFVHVALQWFMASRDVKAFDLNPVFINLSERSVRAVDCRIS